ncbi:sodium-dependent transporter [Halalkalicoccus tibetensis]|uniref:Sodium-dependent transporter n=1 Tax=Halalkalicoccus tibetensis TaxID=175632 RepID=A0ABD5V167_9EURY
MPQRETWATRTGFILAAVGSAVGLGNIWRFPFAVGQEGGAAFLLVYLLFVVLIGFPAMLVEFTLGRRTQKNPVGALAQMGGRTWKLVGLVFVVTGFTILSYYSVIAGWTIRYTFASLTGAYTADPEAYFGAVSVGFDAVAFHALFMVLVIGVIALGVRSGIELAVKFMVPAIIALGIGLAAYAFTLDGAGAAYQFYLSPDLDVLAAEWQSILPAAAGQAFFTLSLGMGVMITYSSYLAEDRNLASDGAIIIGFDTAIAFLMGLILFPFLFTAGVDPGEGGPGTLFISLAAAFAELPAGNILGAVFFGTVAIAALSSAISLLEVPVSYVIDEFGVDRMTATLGVGGLVFVLGLAPALDLIFLDLFDLFADAILLVLGGLLVSIFVSWIVPDEALDELQKGIGELGSIGTAWVWAVRIPVVLVLAFSLYLGIVGYIEFLTTDFADWLG